VLAVPDNPQTLLPVPRIGHVLRQKERWSTVATGGARQIYILALSRTVDQTMYMYMYTAKRAESGYAAGSVE